MFGYVTPLKLELKVKDFNKFKSYYCGLCIHIKEEFGNIPRFVLNYDMTFLALILDSISNEEPSSVHKVCFAHPTKKSNMMVNNKALSYSANINVALAYYKMVDDVNDDKSLKSKLSSLLLSGYKKKFSHNLTEVDNLISEKLNDLYIYEERKNFSSLDEICHPFSEIVASILSLYPYELIDDSKDLRDNLYNFGYSLGKWIYLIDALDDLKEDMEKNKFNPINHLFNNDFLPYEEFLPKIKDRIEFSIFSCGSLLKNTLDNLPISRNYDILSNIIELGMVDKYYNIFKTTCDCKSKDNKQCNSKKSNFNKNTNKKGSEFSHESI